MLQPIAVLISLVLNFIPGLLALWLIRSLNQGCRHLELADTCPSCQYNRANLISGTACPECGSLQEPVTISLPPWHVPLWLMFPQSVGSVIVYLPAMSGLINFDPADLLMHVCIVVVSLAAMVQSFVLLRACNRSLSPRTAQLVTGVFLSLPLVTGVALGGPSWKIPANQGELAMKLGATILTIFASSTFLGLVAISILALRVIRQHPASPDLSEIPVRPR